MSWSCHQRCANGAAYTIGGTPDRARAPGVVAQGTTGDRPRGSGLADLRRWVNHDHHCADDRAPCARCRAQGHARHPPPDHRRRRRGPRAPPRPARGVGAGRLPGGRGPRGQRHPVLRRSLAGAARRVALRPQRARPGERVPAGSPSGPDPTAGRLGPRDRAGRPGSGDGADRGSDLRQRPRDLGRRPRRARLRPAVAPGRRGPTVTLARPVGAPQPGPRSLRQRGLGVVPPGRSRIRLRRGGGGAVRGPPRPGVRRVRRADLGRARRGRPRRHPGSVDLAAHQRPVRRACRAGAHPGARRPRRTSARLGPADPRPDPEERRRRGDGRPSRAVAGARPARVALREHAGRRPQPRRAPCARSCARSRTPTASTWSW